VINSFLFIQTETGSSSQFKIEIVISLSKMP